MAAGEYDFGVPQVDEHGYCYLSDLKGDECHHCRHGMRSLGYVVNADARRGNLITPHKEGEMPAVFEL